MFGVFELVGIIIIILYCYLLNASVELFNVFSKVFVMLLILPSYLVVSVICLSSD